MSVAPNTANIGVLAPSTGANYIELLPTEILSSILAEVCQSYPLPGPKAAISRDMVAHILSWVSPRFLYVARKTACLWVNFGLYPFAPPSETTQQMLGHQVTGVLHSGATNIFIWVFHRRADALKASYDTLFDHVRKTFVPLCSTAMVQRWALFDASTPNWLHMRALLPRFENRHFPELDTLKLAVVSTPDFPHAEQYFGSATFPKLRLLELHHVAHPGLALRADVPTTLAVKYAFVSAATRVPGIWSTMSVAGASLDTVKLDVTVKESDDGYLVPAQVGPPWSNRYVRRLDLDAASLECLVMTGEFPEAADLVISKLRDADHCAAVLGLVVRHGEKRPCNGSTFAPNIQSLAFDMHGCIETAPQLWRKLFDRVSQIQSVSVISPLTAGSSASVSTATIRLACGGIRLWPRLVRLEFRGRSKDIISRVLAGLVGRHARTSAPQIKLSVDFETEVHLGGWYHDNLWARMEKGFVYDVQPFE